MKLLRLTQPTYTINKDNTRTWDLAPVYINPAQIVGVTPVMVKVDEQRVEGSAVGRVDPVLKPGSSITTPGGMDDEMCGFTVTETPDEILKELAKF